GPDGPANACDLRGDDAAQKPAASIAELNLRPDQRDNARKADDEAQTAPRSQPLAVGQHRVDADHPEWRGCDENGGQTAWDGLLGPDDAAIAKPEQQEAEHGESHPCG